MPRNDAAAPGQLWPGIRIHVIDIVQPPGIGMPPISDMDEHQPTVSAALVTQVTSTNTDKPGHVRRDASSKAMVTFAQAMAYSSWRRHHTPVSVRPFGARFRCFFEGLAMGVIFGIARSREWWASSTAAGCLLVMR